MKTVLCYGDSNTWGCVPIEAWPPASIDRYGEGERWGGVLRTSLGDGYRVIEEGLNARTSVWPDPIDGEHRNGKAYLLACLQSHAPLDMVALMLGTNDMKSRFGLSPSDIGYSIGTLVEIIQASATGPGNSCPQILVMCPPPLGRLSVFVDVFAGAQAKSAQLPQYYQRAAREHNCGFLDVGALIKTSDRDGLHFEASEQRKLGLHVADCVRKTLE